jgi:hypothetical protein
MSKFLNIAEEVLLLAIEEKGGLDPHSKTLDIVLASAVLMDLAVHHMIDSDGDILIPKVSEPTGDPLRDKVLAGLLASPEQHTFAFWIAKIGFRAEELKAGLLASLVEKGILKVENKTVFWFFKTRKYPIVADSELKEVKARIREFVLGEHNSDIHDWAILSLINYGGMLPTVFDEAEFHLNRKRIAELARTNPIGRAISAALETMSPSFQLATMTKSLVHTKSAQEKLDKLVEEMKLKYHIEDDEDLPDWLRKGTSQYEKTLEFIEKTGTNNIYYHHFLGEYFVINNASVFSS